MRNIILHAHLFKNAGSTIDWVLQNNYGKKFVDHRRNDLMKNNHQYLVNYIENNTKLTAISSHHMPMPPPVIPGINIILIVMLRHPIERVTSVYNFEKKQMPGVTPGSAKANSLPINDYVKWRLSNESSGVIKNFHVRSCIGKSHSSELNKTDLDDAKSFFVNHPSIGIVEEFNKSMLLIEDTIKAIDKNFDASYIRLNATQKKKESVANRIEQLKSQLDVSVFEELYEFNKYDIELYDFVIKLVNTRFIERNLKNKNLEKNPLVNYNYFSKMKKTFIKRITKTSTFR